MRFIRYMTSFAIILLAVLAIQFTPTADATNCQAIGSMTVNSAGFGSGGTTNTRSTSITLSKDGKQVGGTNHNVCTDIYSVTSQLPYTFGWAASCSNAIE